MICKICGFNMGLRGSYSHLHYKHNLSVKEYYDLYLKTEDEGICKLDNCNKNHCCISHASLDKTTQIKIQETCLKRYGVRSSNQSDIVKAKMKQTLINHIE